MQIYWKLEEDTRDNCAENEHQSGQGVRHFIFNWTFKQPSEAGTVMAQ